MSSAICAVLQSLRAYLGNIAKTIIENKQARFVMIIKDAQGRCTTSTRIFEACQNKLAKLSIMLFFLHGKAGLEWGDVGLCEHRSFLLSAEVFVRPQQPFHAHVNLCWREAFSACMF